MCSPSRLPLWEKLEQLSISSAPAQRATAVACRVSPERADHTERQYSRSSATGRMASAVGWAPTAAPGAHGTERADNEGWRVSPATLCVQTAALGLSRPWHSSGRNVPCQRAFRPGNFFSQ